MLPLRTSRPEVFQRGSGVPVFHRGHVEVRAFDVRDRQQRKRRELGQIQRLEVSAAAAAHLDAPILPLLVGRRRDERLAAVPAVNARVYRQLPGGGTERAT